MTASDVSWTINCTVLIHVDLSCPHCSLLVVADADRLSTVHLILIVSFMSLVLVSVIIAVAVFCRRIKTAHKASSRYDLIHATFTLLNIHNSFRLYRVLGAGG